MAATRKSRSQKYTQTGIDPLILPVVVKALENRQIKKPRCPVPDCDWESYVEPNTWRHSSNESAISRLKRHLRDKHRAYYHLATAKPFVIYEEEDHTWSLTLS